MSMQWTHNLQLKHLRQLHTTWLLRQLHQINQVQSIKRGLHIISQLLEG